MIERDSIEEDSMTAVLSLVDPHLLERHDLTVDDLADLPEDLRYELIDGRLVLTPHALPLHQVIAMRTAVAIEEHCPEYEFVVNGEQAVAIGRRTELKPDVVLIRVEGANRSPVLPDDVPLVVEVISRSSKHDDRTSKMKKYAMAGISHYWIIDPLEERVTFTQYRLGADGNYHQQLHTDELVTVREPWEITLDLPGWTRRRDFLEKVGRPGK
ncbi:Uma2 family endonuclease [Actinoplanes sp. Pm04-4]|uniref:Uma2 family endonuclease n=1 Tax=Paractinoplanes pyxinae TaxID=2997416 RepID=A0ABT4B1C7_9ACTN|nr:Uma2 family endonuclease [Actinoplanes pyxinae]MCY1140301.1 Uma2 family endonuclease [Actinoplanes pyxinae]